MKHRVAFASLILGLAAAAYAVAGPIVPRYITNTDWLTEVQRGNVGGTSSVNKFGSKAVSSGTGIESVVQGATAAYVPPTAARIHQIASADDEDGGAGTDTGALTVTIWGLDSAWAEQTEVVTLNGTTDVATASAYVRIFRMRTATAGSNGTNVGAITATADTDLTVTSTIPAGKGGTFQTQWTVPAAKDGYVVATFASINRQGAASGAMVEFDLWVTTGLDTATPASYAAHSMPVAVNGTGSLQLLFKIPKKFTGPADIEIRKTYSTDNNVVVNAGFDLFYE